MVIGIITLLGVVQSTPGSARSAAQENVPSTRTGSLSPHSGGVSSVAPVGTVGVIKKIKLAGYPETTVGDAFDRYRYFSKKQWSETKSSYGNLYVDFIGYFPTGWFDFDKKKAGVSANGVEIKFVVYPNGTYGVAMVSKIEARIDGTIMRYPLPDTKAVLDAIYTNKKIDN